MIANHKINELNRKLFFVNEPLSPEEEKEIKNIFEDRLRDYALNLIDSFPLLNQGSWRRANDIYRNRFHLAEGAFERLFAVYRNSTWRNAGRNQETLLMVYARLGNKAAVDQFLLESADLINEKDADGSTALMIAAFSDQLEIVKALLAKNAKIDEENKDKNTALLLAVKKGNKAVIKTLILGGADLSKTEKNGLTAFMIAVQKNMVEVLDLFLFEKPDCLNQTDLEGNTVLMMAAQQGHAEAAGFLMGKNLNINAINKEKFTALMVAVFYNQPHIVEVLLKKNADTNLKNNQEETALDLAKKMGHTDAFNLLENELNSLKIKNGRLSISNPSQTMREDVLGGDKKSNQKSLVSEKEMISQKTFNEIKEKCEAKDFKAAFEMTKEAFAKKMDIKWVEVLFMCLNVNLFKENGREHPHLCQMGRYILDQIEDVKKIKADGQTPLILAAKNKHIRMVRTLKEKGVNLNEENNVGLTALMQAINEGNANMLSELIRLGVDVNKKARNGLTALIMALKVQKFGADSISLLVKNGANVFEALEYFCSNKDNMFTAHKQKCLKDLILAVSAEFSVGNKKDKDGKTLLMCAIDFNDEYATEIILEYCKGVDLDAQCKEQQTALMCAVERNNKNIVSWLVKKEANLNLQNNVGRTALMLAIKKNIEDVVQLLISKKPDLNLKCNQGLTALMYAVEQNNVNAVMLLLDNGADLNLRNKPGQTPLIFAILARKTDVAKLLITKASKEYLDMPSEEQRKTALICAAHKGDLEIINCLIEKQADLNKQDSGGFTALMTAVSKGFKEIVEKLIFAGARVDLKNAAGLTALDVAERQGDKEIKHIIESAIHKVSLNFLAKHK